MAKFRSSNAALAKSLARSSAIVYIVGHDRTVQFSNPACARWLGVDGDHLFGKQVIYGSEPTNDDLVNRLMGLCPPPEVFEETNLHDRDFVISNHRMGEQQRWRHAIACRLADAEEGDFSVLVISSGDDLKAIPESSPDDTRAQQLHQIALEIRKSSRLSLNVESLVGVSPFANRIRRQAKIASASSADLLIVGPAGSGKEHLARTIHGDHKKRGVAGLIPVHCPLADPELLQSVVSELLGPRKSWRDAESNPTPAALLLLDVDQLSPAVQIELLGVMQQPDFSIRVLATATRSLFELAAADRFQFELAHLISTMNIELLPLASRAEDIPLLAHTILEHQNLKRSRQLAGLDKSATQLLVEFAWPGNLDQLREVVQYAARESKSSLVVPGDLPKKFHDSLSAQRIGQPVETIIQLDSYLESIERELIARALQQSKGNKTKAAQLLSVNRAKLLRRLQYFQMESEPNVESDESGLIEPSAFEEIE